MSDLVRARWTDAIHDEWLRNLLRNRPDLTAEQLERTRDLMNRAVLDCLVTGYEKLIERVGLVKTTARPRFTARRAVARMCCERCRLRLGKV
jgi:hypothetical protein